MIRLDQGVTQEEFGELVGVSQQAISDLIDRNILSKGAPVGQWLHEYCDNLREQAAGRNQELARERARLAREQADKIAMANAVTRREMASVSVITEVLARVSRQIAAHLEAIPVKIKRKAGDMPKRALDIIEEETIVARNLAYSIELDWEEFDGLEGDSDSGQDGPEAT